MKSTLRPQSPWEVHKRNEDVLEGIRHTAEILGRLGGAATGIVITDGYEGDYATWKESLATGVPVARLEDLEWIAENPRAAFDVLARRAGIEPGSPPKTLPERSVDLCSWKMTLLDQVKPSTSQEESNSGPH